MNLIKDAWVPVQTKSGRHLLITPFEITKNIKEDPIVKLNLPRADFSGAMMQFLIGIFQTIFIHTSVSLEDWHHYYKWPFSVSDMKKLMHDLIPFFNIFSSNGSFMQDLNLEITNESEKIPIRSLLIEQPGAQTLTKNKDFYIPRDKISQLCCPCAALGLYTLQINAPSGGMGHRTSLRGGGPLTTLLVSDLDNQTLWNDIWLNILPSEDFFSIHRIQESHKNFNENPHLMFPWMGKTLTSGENEQVSPADVNPIQLYWEMSRRIKLNVASKEKNECSICGQKSYTIDSYITKNYGTRYHSSWRHPLTPYRVYKEQEFPMHLQGGGLGYQHWLPILFKSPAQIIKHAIEKKSLQEQYRLWAFGYDMDNMKARCWYETQMPFYIIPDEVDSKEIISYIESFIKITDQARYYLFLSLKSCGMHDDSDQKEIYSLTEIKFYEMIYELIHDHKSEEEIQHISLSWLDYIKKTTIKLFDKRVNLLNFPIQSIKSIIIQRNYLKNNLMGKKIFNLLPFADKNKLKNKE